MPRRAFFLAALLAAACIVLRADPPPHADAFSNDELIKANAADLKDTQLVAHPDVPLDPAKNVIWCGTLQLAWNEAIDLVGEKLRFVTQPPLVDLLNREDFTRKDLAPGSYVAIADFERKHVVAKIRAALERVFHGAASPELIPVVPRNAGPDDFVAYAYLFKDLAFPQPFLDGEPITFLKTSVASFGFTGEPSDLRDKLVKEVTICSYNSADDFVIKLKTKVGDDELILAKIPPKSSLHETIQTTMDRVAASDGSTPGFSDMLSIPKLNFDLRRDFEELEGLVLNPSPAAKIKSNLVIAKAEQLVRFQLNEKGAVLKSEAVIIMPTGIAFKPDRHEMIFDKPFLILMKQADSPQPYFAMWVGNASLLIPAK
jgi:hypothetical protein